MKLEERIRLRDELIRKMYANGVMRKINGMYSTNYCKNNIQSVDDSLKKEYDSYVSEFRSEREALYCLTHLDDFSNHVCPICGNLCSFYEKQNKYRVTCGSDECKKFRIGSGGAKDRCEQTNLDKYDKENAQSDECKSKIGSSVLDNLSAEYSMQPEEVRGIAGQIMLERHGTERAPQVEKHNVEKSEILNIRQYSDLENSFMAFLNEHSISYDINHTIGEHHKDCIDIFCGDFNVGFEINDIATHNSLDGENGVHKDKFYHRDKSILAKSCGVQLIHLWEWELRDEKQRKKLFNWILNIFNTKKIRIFARKCDVCKVPLDEEKQFLNSYHLQGYMKSAACFGLYINDELVQLMSFSKPRFNKKYEWELLRLCTRYGCTVIGGANRLLKHFVKQYMPKSIISYCNFDKFQGRVYENLGFKSSRSSEPQITWCNKDMKHFSQSSLTWIGADKLLGVNYGKGTNNEEIVIRHGYVPVYTCGVGAYTMNFLI